MPPSPTSPTNAPAPSTHPAGINPAVSMLRNAVSSNPNLAPRRPSITLTTETPAAESARTVTTTVMQGDDGITQAIMNDAEDLMARFSHVTSTDALNASTDGINQRKGKGNHNAQGKTLSPGGSNVAIHTASDAEDTSQESIIPKMTSSRLSRSMSAVQFKAAVNTENNRMGSFATSVGGSLDSVATNGEPRSKKPPAKPALDIVTSKWAVKFVGITFSLFFVLYACMSLYVLTSSDYEPLDYDRGDADKYYGYAAFAFAIGVIFSYMGYNGAGNYEKRILSLILLGVNTIALLSYVSIMFRTT